MASTFKVTFELDEQDAAYFRALYRKAKKNASRMDPDANPQRFVQIMRETPVEIVERGRHASGR